MRQGSKSEADLRARLVAEPRRQVVSTFDSLPVAERVLYRALRSNKSAIEAWARGARPLEKQEFFFTSGEVAGTVLTRATNQFLRAGAARQSRFTKVETSRRRSCARVPGTSWWRSTTFLRGSESASRLAFSGGPIRRARPTCHCAIAPEKMPVPRSPILAATGAAEYILCRGRRAIERCRILE